MKSFREQMLGIIRGETPPGPLFVPRLDIWYNANRSRGTLPADAAGLALPELMRSLDLGLHSVVPQFLSTGREEAIHHRALGFYNHPDFPFLVDFGAVDFEVEGTPSELVTRYHLPGGDITTRICYGDEFLRSGASIPDLNEHAIKSAADYALLADLLGRVRIVPQPAGYEQYRQRLGDDGIAVAYLSLACSPFHHIMRDLRKVEAFFLDMIDEFSVMEPLLEVLGHIYDQLIDAACQTSAEVVLFGANYDDAITCPPLFQKHFVAWLAKAADRLHSAGKYLLTHTDGENKLLSRFYPQCNFDIADSVCPAPMTKLSLREYRKALGQSVTIWGGIPSIMMLPSLVGEDDFRAYVSSTLRATTPYDRIIFSIADTAPPDMDWGRFLHIREQMAHG